MFNDRTILVGTCVAAAFSALVAGTITFLSAAQAARDSIVFETPTSHLKSDRLDKIVPPGSRQSRDCSKYGWPYYDEACIPDRNRDVRFVSIGRDLSR